MGFGNHFQDIKGNEFFCEIDESYLEKFLEGYEYGEGPEEPNFMQQVPDHCYAAEKLSNFSCECSKFCEGPCYYYHEDLAYFDNHVCGGKYEDARPFKCNKREAMLYGLLHARYIMTNAGMEKMEKKHTKGEFGYCPRVYCENQPLLPMGLSDIPKKCTVKMYCPKCEDLYHPRSTRFHSIDGSYFGTSFPHMFLMAFPELRPKPAKFSYEPLLYGFKIHPEAKELQLQKAELANQAKQKEMEQKKKQQVEKANKQEKAKKQEKANKQEKAQASKDQNKENPADKVDDNKAVDKKQKEVNVEQEAKDKECKAESEKVITVIEQEAKDKECKAESEQVITVIEQEAKDKECKGEGEKDEGEKESKEVLQKKEILDADKNQAVDRDNKDNKGQDQDNIQKEETLNKDIRKDNEKETEIAKVAEQQIAEKQEDSGLHKVEEKRLGNEQSEQNPEKKTEDQRAEEISGKKENQLDQKPDENVQEHMDKEEETVATAKDKEESNVDKDTAPDKTMVESSVNIDKVEMSEEVKQRLRRRSKEDELKDQEPPSKTQKHTT